MDSFLFFFIILVIGISSLIDFIKKNHNHSNSYKNDPQTQNKSDRKNHTNNKGNDYYPGSHQKFKDQECADYVFFYEKSSDQIGNVIHTNLTDAQFQGEQFAENGRKPIDIFKIIGGEKLWVDKIYPWDYS